MGILSVAILATAAFGGLGAYGTNATVAPGPPIGAANAASPPASPSGQASTGLSPTPRLTPVAASAQPTPEPSLSLIPLVPIVSFWSTERSVSRTELRLLLISGDGRDLPANPRPVAVSAADLPALADALDVEPERVRTMSPADVRAFVKTTPDAFGIVRADDVTIGVRALAVDGVALLGSGRDHSPERLAASCLGANRRLALRLSIRRPPSGPWPRVAT